MKENFMINYNAIDDSILINKPFKYSCINQLISEMDAKTLREQMPKDFFSRSIRDNGSDKTYNVLNNILFNLEQQATQKNELIPPLWMALLADLTSDDYRLRLENLLKEDLSDCYQEITLKVYRQGDFLSYHTDKENVKATHMLFFNDTWNESWGGQLHFSGAKDAEPFIKFSPLWMHSVAFVRAENSWHAVPKVSVPSVERIALQVAFWNIKQRQVLPGRVEKQVHSMD